MPRATADSTRVHGMQPYYMHLGRKTGGLCSWEAGGDKVGTLSNSTISKRTNLWLNPAGKQAATRWLMKLCVAGTDAATR